MVARDRGQRGAGAFRVRLRRNGERGDAELRERLPEPARLAVVIHVGLVLDHHGLDVGDVRGHQRLPDEPAIERRPGRVHDEHAVDVGRQFLGPEGVGAEQERGAGADGFDARQPRRGRARTDEVADDDVALPAAARCGPDGAAVVLDQGLPAECRHDPRLEVRRIGGLRGLAHATGAVAPGAWIASAFAAQMKSLPEMPPTECVLKRTSQRS